jgi:hypothetical protein
MTDDLQQALADLVRRLEASRIEYMLVGSVAALAHGRSRSTHDFDLVIEAGRDALLTFVRALPTTRYYVSEEAALEALAHASQFNVLDLDTGWKVDLIPRKDRPFSRTEFARRRAMTLLGGEYSVATLEDTILAKLEWAKAAGGSARQLEDVRELLQTGAAALDREYLDGWIERLDLKTEWARANEVSTA